MSFKIEWHQPDVARLWPRGSVVLFRTDHHSSYGTTKYSYILALFFSPDTMPKDMGWEYALIEEARKEIK